MIPLHDGLVDGHHHADLACIKVVAVGRQVADLQAAAAEDEALLTACELQNQHPARPQFINAGDYL